MDIEIKTNNIEKNYKLGKKLGSGGMGDVYLAIDKRLERIVAIKILKFHNSEDIRAEFISRFKIEAKAIAKLSHPNIVSIYDFVEENDQFYMIMEFLDGKSLLTALEDEIRRIPISLVIAIGVQICSALEYSHQHKIIHRDIKPENIILSRNGVVKLTDFGIAQMNINNAMKDVKSENDGSIIGSIKYSSPEQLINSSTVDKRTDIYSLGITLYELLTGVHPFNTNNTGELIMKIYKETPLPLREHYWDIPVALENIINKAIAKDPELRYQSAIEMGKELSDLISNNSLKNVLLSSVFNMDNIITPEDIKFLTHSTKDNDENLSKITHKDLKIIASNNSFNKIKNDFLWINELVKDLKTENIANQNKYEFLQKAMDISFNGIAYINTETIAFFYNGYLIDFVSINNNLQEEDLFNLLPDNLANIKLKFACDNNVHLPIIIYNILTSSGSLLQENISSLFFDLSDLQDSFKSDENKFTGYIVCKKDSDIYYYGYYHGEQIFSFSFNNTGYNKCDDNFNHIVTTNKSVFNIYHPQLKISKLNSIYLLKNSLLTINFISQDKCNFESIINNKNLVNEAQAEELKNNINLLLELSPKVTKLELYGSKIDLTEIYKNSIAYKFCDFLFKEYFFLIKSTENTEYFKLLFNSFKYFKHVSFHDLLLYKSFNSSLAIYNLEKTKILGLILIGKNIELELNNLIEYIINLKKNDKNFRELVAVFYISTGSYSINTLKEFSKYTKKSLLNKYKGFIKSGIIEGFHLSLIEYKPHESSFSIVAPSLY